MTTELSHVDKVDTSVPPALELRGVHKSFGGLHVITDMDLTVPAGERHAIIGPNGAGKTTLFNLITGWDEPTGGTIRVAGKAMPKARPDLVARAGLARSFQKNALLDGLSVLENLRIACQAFDASRHAWLRPSTAFPAVIEAARHQAERMGLSAVLERTVNGLSYGQKRQLEVAIALCAKPRILLMDEPAAGTSPQERDRLVRLISELPRDLSIVLVEHDMEVVFAVCERVTVMSYGKVLAQGAPEEVRTDPHVIAAYLGAAPDRTERNDA